MMQSDPSTSVGPITTCWSQTWEDHAEFQIARRVFIFAAQPLEAGGMPVLSQTALSFILVILICSS